MNASIVRRISTTETLGSSIGKVIERNVRDQPGAVHLDALVDLARDRLQAGEQEERHQRRRLPDVGQDQHVERAPRRARARSGTAPRMCSWVSSALSEPYCALRTPRHIAPLTTVGSAHGSTTIARNSQRNRNGALSSSASNMPKTSSSAVDAIVKYSVRSIVDQKSGSLTMLV